MSNTIWPKPEMHSEMKKYGRKITPCHPMPSEHYMREELKKYPHLKRTEEKPQWIHLCGNGITSGHFCANPDHIKIGTHKENMNMPDAHPEETRRKRSEAHKGIPKSEEHKRKISEARKGKPQPKVTCPHCGKPGSIQNMKRWHFDKCPLKPERDEFYQYWNGGILYALVEISPDDEIELKLNSKANISSVRLVKESKKFLAAINKPLWASVSTNRMHWRFLEAIGMKCDGVLYEDDKDKYYIYHYSP